MQLLKIHSFKVHKMLSDPRVKERINEKVKINNKFCIPYLAGYSKDGKTIYVDHHFNPIMKDGTDITKFLLIHEKTEKALIDFFHLPYQQAHHIATHVELEAVKKAGIDHDKYLAFYRNPISKSEHECSGSYPDDLDITPYKDEGDILHKKVIDVHTD